MWDTVDSARTRLTHDMPCPRCGHAPHTYLACSDECSCVPAEHGLDDLMREHLLSRA